MNFRLTGILAVAAAILGLLILFWDRDDDTMRARVEQARRAFRFDPARVDRLIIESGDLSIECLLKGRQWHLVRPIAVRADPVAIERLLGALQELPRGDILLPPRRAPDAYLPYGLDAPRTSISIIEGTSTNQILIGRRTPLGDGVYVRQSDHAGLARLDTSLLDLLPTSADALRDRTLLSGAPAAIERLDVRSPAGYTQLARNENGEWRLFQPFAARADSATVSTLIEQLLSCSVAQFVQDAARDLAPYGLDGPSAVTAVLNTDAGDGSQMLSLGDPLPNDPTLVYARLQGENSVYAVPLTVRQALLLRSDDFRDRRIPGLDPASIQQVRIEAVESVLEFIQDDDGAWRITAPLRAPADSEAIQSLLHAWSEVRLESFETQSPTHELPALSRTIRIVNRGSKTPPVVLRIGPGAQAADSTRIAIEGDSSIALAKPPRLLDFPLAPLLYRSREILSIPPGDIASIQITTAAQTLRFERNPDTGQWSPASAWIDGLLAALLPLRAESLLSDQGYSNLDGLSAPHLTLTLQLRGQSGLAITLVVGSELTPGGARQATIRGRNLVFALSPQVVSAFLPPASKEAE